MRDDLTPDRVRIARLLAAARTCCRSCCCPAFFAGGLSLANNVVDLAGGGRADAPAGLALVVRCPPSSPSWCQWWSSCPPGRPPCSWRRAARVCAGPKEAVVDVTPQPAAAAALPRGRSGAARLLGRVEQPELVEPGRHVERARCRARRAAARAARSRRSARGARRSRAASGCRAAGPGGSAARTPSSPSSSRMRIGPNSESALRVLGHADLRGQVAEPLLAGRPGSRPRPPSAGTASAPRGSCAGCRSAASPPRRAPARTRPPRSGSRAGRGS